MSVKWGTEMKNTIKDGQMVLANTKVTAYAYVNLFRDTITDGREVTICKGSAGRVLKANGDRLLVSWRTNTLGWIDAECVDIAETHEFENVTVFIKSEFFGITTIHCKRLKVERLPYAQYPRATRLVFRQPRKRKDRITWLYDDQSMHVVGGKDALEFDNFGQVVKRRADCSVSHGKHSFGSKAWTGEIAGHAAAVGKVLYSQDAAGNRTV